jgi:hypothetical protein
MTGDVRSKLLPRNVAALRRFQDPAADRARLPAPSGVVGKARHRDAAEQCWITDVS